MAQVKYKDKWHQEMLLKICDELKNEEFGDVKRLCKGDLTNRELADINDVRDLIDQLERRGEIKKGNYENIIDTFTAARLPKVVEIIELYKEEIDNAPERPNIRKRSGSSLKSQSSAESDSVPGTPMSPSLPPVFESPLKRQKSNGAGDKYERKPGCKGLVLIINNNHFLHDPDLERDGSKTDEKNLKELFSNNIDGYEVVDYRDLTYDKFNEKLIQAQAKLEYGKYDQFLCFLMSHGGQKGIMTTDKKFVTVESIVQKFKCDEVQKLAGLPKVFIVQACRGGKSQPCVSADDEGQTKKQGREFIDTADLAVTVPVDADILIGYSTTKGYVSLRNDLIGSWYIHNICDVFKYYYRNEHVMDMLTRVHQRVSCKTSKSADYRQMPNFDSTFCKKMYLC